MASCPRCRRTFEAAELRRHERSGMVLVHCPSCGQLMGEYNRHGGRPRRRG